MIEGRDGKAGRMRGLAHLRAMPAVIPATLAAALPILSGPALAQASDAGTDTSLTLLFGLGVGAAGFAVALIALRRARNAALEAGRAARDLDAVSRRLIELESRIGQEMPPAQPLPAGIGAQAAIPEDEDDLFAAARNELTVEIGLLGGLVKDIADAVADHDRTLETLSADVGSLRSEIAADMARHALAPVLAPAPAMPVPVPVAAATQPAPVSRPAQALPHVAAPPPDPAQMPQVQPPQVQPPQVSVPAATSSPAPAPVSPAAVPAGASAPAVRAVARDEPGDAEARQAQLELAILAAAAADSIELHLQAVVGLPQRRVRFYEALSRLRLADGRLLIPAEFLPVLERRGKATRFDEAAIARVLQVARHLAQRDAAAAVSFNLGAASIAEPGYLRGLDRVFAGWPDIAGRIILEIPQRVLKGLDLERLGALAAMTGRGVRLCVDRASDLRIDPGMLAERGVTYLKLPASLLLGEEAQRTDIHAADLAALLARAGITLIAEKVESEDVVRELLDLDISLAQGFLFSTPRPVRAEVLAGMAGQAGDPPPPAADPALPAAGQERRPFRDFLRRA